MKKLCASSRAVGPFRTNSTGTSLRKRIVETAFSRTPLILIWIGSAIESVPEAGIIWRRSETALAVARDDIQ
jgi:hypothetical protein